MNLNNLQKMMNFNFGIKEKVIVVLLGICVLLFFAIGFYAHELTITKADRDIQKENVRVLESRPKITISQSGDTVKAIGVLKQTIKELQTNNSSLLAHISDMKIKTKHVTSIGTGTTTTTQGGKVVFIPDTDTIHDTVFVKEKIGYFNDTWTHAVFHLRGDTMKFSYQRLDTLYYVKHIEKIGKFKPINIIPFPYFWRKKHEVISSKSACPYQSILLQEVQILK